MSRFLISVTICFLLEQPGYAQKQSIFPSQLIQFSKSDLLKIKKDYPIKNIIIDKNANIWFSGKTYLWIYEPHFNKLHRIKDTTQKINPVHSLHSRGNSVFSMRKQSIHQIHLLKKKTLHIYQTKHLKQSRSIKFLINNSHAYWVTTKGFYKLDYHKKKILYFRKLKKEILMGNHHTTTEKATLWWSLKNKLYSCELNKLCDKIKTHIKLDTKILDVKIHKNNIFVQTKSFVIIFNPKGHIIKNIPIKESNNISKIILHKNYHHYFFTNSVLETHALKNKNTAHYSINLPVHAKLLDQSFNKRYAAFATTGRPLVYRLFNLKKSN